MSLRDYKQAQQAKRTGKLLLSIKGLLTPLECTPTICQGRCCRKHNANLTSHYHSEELSKLPVELLEFVDTTNSNSIRIDSKGNCKLIPYCMENSSIIPTECRLFPLGFNKCGRLVLKRWVYTGACPMYGKGQPIYIAMRQCLVDVFGEVVYSNIVHQIENNTPRF